MKYDRPPEWKIGDSKRSPLYSNEIFEYYKHDYDENSDCYGAWDLEEEEILKEINKQVTLSRLFLIIEAFKIKSTILPEVVFILIVSP